MVPRKANRRSCHHHMRSTSCRNGALGAAAESSSAWPPAEQVDIDAMQQGGEPQLLVLLRCLTYTVQPAWPALPALRPVRVRLCRVLLGQRPSLHGLLRPSLACVRLLDWFYAAVRLPVAVRVGLIAYRLLPPFRPLPAAESHRVSRFSRAQTAPSFYACVGSTTPQGRNVLALFAHAAVLPSGWPDTVGAHGFGDFGAHQLQGYPAHICPWPTLQFKCSVTTALTWSGVRMVRYSFPV